MIELENVSKSYRTNTGFNHVLRNVSITFPSNCSIGILGLNGTGKSTLIRILGRAEEPDSGIVKSDTRVSWPLGYSGGFQNNLTARENCRFVAAIRERNFAVRSAHRRFGRNRPTTHVEQRQFDQAVKYIFGTVVEKFETIVVQYNQLGNEKVRAQLEHFVGLKADWLPFDNKNV